MPTLSRPTNRRRRTIGLYLTVLLSACGGGGGSTPAPAPTPALDTIAPRLLSQSLVDNSDRLPFNAPIEITASYDEALGPASELSLQTVDGSSVALSRSLSGGTITLRMLDKPTPGTSYVASFKAADAAGNRAAELRIRFSTLPMTLLMAMQRCPASDPAYAQIRADLVILRDGLPIAEPACSEPISAMPEALLSKELQLIQNLRFAYYMDRGRSGHLPWTPLSFYDWLRSQRVGFNINTTATFNYCCTPYKDQPLINLTELLTPLDRQQSQSWHARLGGVALIGHEARHVDGFAHNSRCGRESGCDASYDETKLSPYGIQYWLTAHWLSGDINVGLGCLSEQERVGEVLSNAAANLRGSFAQDPPPLLAIPALPGGACR